MKYGPATSSIMTIGPHVFETEEDIRKKGVMEKLFHVGVIFKHKNSKVQWQVIEVRNSEDTGERFVWAKSLKSGYRKAIWASAYTYDTFDLIDAPEAVKVLYGDKKHDGSIVGQDDTSTSQEPQTPDTVFEETDLSEIDKSGD